MEFAAKTREGKMVTIVDSEIVDGSRPFTSKVLTGSDGRTYRPLGGGMVEEIVVMDSGTEENLAAAVTEAKETGLINETERLTPEEQEAFAREAAAANGTEQEEPGAGVPGGEEPPPEMQ